MHPSIVFTGSSIMALWESLPQFFPGVALRNTAVSGSHTHEILARLDELVIAHQPDVLCYYCGSNDINYDTPAERIVQNVLTTHARLRAALGALDFVYLSIIKAPQKRDRWDVVDAVNDALRRHAALQPGFTFVDINPVFFTPEGQPRMDFYVSDQLHLTPEAYRALGGLVAPRVLSILRSRTADEA